MQKRATSRGAPRRRVVVARRKHSKVKAAAAQLGVIATGAPARFGRKKLLSTIVEDEGGESKAPAHWKFPCSTGVMSTPTASTNGASDEAKKDIAAFVDAVFDWGIAPGAEPLVFPDRAPKKYRERGNSDGGGGLLQSGSMPVTALQLLVYKSHVDTNLHIHLFQFVGPALCVNRQLHDLYKRAITMPPRRPSLLPLPAQQVASSLLIPSPRAIDQDQVPAGHTLVVRTGVPAFAPAFDLSTHSDGVNAAAWSPNGEVLATGGDDGVVRLVSMQRPAPSGSNGDNTTDESRSLPQACKQLVVSPAVENLAADADAEVDTDADADADEAAPAARESTALSPVVALDVSSNGLWLCAAHLDGTIRAWKTRPDAGATYHHVQMSGHTKTPWEVRVSPCAELVCSRGDDRTLRVWEIASGRPLWTASDLDVLSICWAPDGRHIASSQSDGKIAIWDARTGHRTSLLSITGAPRLVSVQWSPDGSQIVAGGTDAAVHVIPASGDGSPRCMQGHEGAIMAALWSPDGASICSRSEDGTVRIWNAVTCAQVACLDGHRDAVRCVAWSPCGTRVCSGSYDETAMVWDASTGKLLHRLVGHHDVIRAVTWSPSGDALCTASSDGKARIWLL